MGKSWEWFCGGIVVDLARIARGEGHHKGPGLKLKPWASCGVGFYGSII
ncbi:MAG: hypothetical protein GY737_14550 [Desulfobacteraceae bacterium]|nr:hypothetical protein [Desulfobacteraceae bacterium]